MHAPILKGTDIDLLEISVFLSSEKLNEKG